MCDTLRFSLLITDYGKPFNSNFAFLTNLIKCCFSREYLLNFFTDKLIFDEEKISHLIKKVFI